VTSAADNFMEEGMTASRKREVDAAPYPYRYAPGRTALIVHCCNGAAPTLLRITLYPFDSSLLTTITSCGPVIG